MISKNRVDGTRLEKETDEALCGYAAQGNRQAEEILITRYHRLVRSCARTTSVDLMISSSKFNT